MKIALVDKVSLNKVKKLLRTNVDAIVYLSIDKKANYKELEKSFKLINAFTDASQSNWFGYRKVELQLQKVKEKFPKIMNYKGIDLEEALKKDLFWAFLKTNTLYYKKETLEGSGNVFLNYFERNSLVKRLSLVRKLFFLKNTNYQLDIKSEDPNLRNSIAFRVNNNDVCDIYGNLFDYLRKESLVSFQTILKSQPTKSNYIFKVNILNKPKLDQLFKLSAIEKIKMLFSKSDPDFINTLLDIMNKLCNHVVEYERLFKSGIRTVVINAGENEGEGNVLCAVAKKYNITTINYINGTKAKDPQNIITNFDYWFMPDLETKNLLISYCKITDNQLPITGHLLYEVAMKHNYSGTLNKYIERMNNKKIIALCTSKIFFNEKFEVLSFLTEYLKVHTNILVLLRSHPDEMESEDILHERIIKLPPMPNVQESLFDLLLYANLVISFSSTVSIQAAWFNKPSLNYEVSPESRLPYVDNIHIFKITNIDNLRSCLDKFLFEGVTLKKKVFIENSAKKIADILIST